MVIMMSRAVAVSSLLAGVLCSQCCLALPIGDSGHLGEQTTAALLAVSIGSLVCIILAVFGCVCCCGKTSILKYEESVEYDDGHANGRSNDAFADFSPPTQSTPSVPPGGITETVSIEQLPDLSRLQGVTTHGVPQVGYRVWFKAFAAFKFHNTEFHILSKLFIISQVLIQLSMNISKLKL
ncbi:uncharacterized protein, partial [Diadema antillarum]|uniref:uncharacterized protein n=1 Tax=Diadema antillarum TaxID=105358 RepID=UPI003A871281